MSLIKLEVDLIHRAKGIAILSDGQEVPITNWFDTSGDDCAYDDAVSCVCGPDFDGMWYAVDLEDFAGAVIQ